MTIFELLQTMGVRVAYGRHTDRVAPPYLMVIGAGQDHFDADNTYYYVQDLHTIEYYFKKKNPAFERQLESLLLDNGYRYEKSEDLYLDDEDIFMIYYDV